jgi:hypothetical protein
LATKKLAHWYRYVSDTFIVWTHRKERLHGFLQHLNSIHTDIKFTADVEQDRTLSFLDFLVSRRPDGSLGHTAYRKPTHTDLYSHARSEHHLPQKHAALNTGFGSLPEDL